MARWGWASPRRQPSLKSSGLLPPPTLPSLLLETLAFHFLPQRERSPTIPTLPLHQAISSPQPMRPPPRSPPQVTRRLQREEATSGLAPPLPPNFFPFK